MKELELIINKLYMNGRFVKVIAFFYFVLWSSSLRAENSEVDDFFRSTGKINVLAGVILIIFIGIVIYLIRLDRKIKSLENRIKNEQ